MIELSIKPMGYSQQQFITFIMTQDTLEVVGKSQSLIIDDTDWKLTKNPNKLSKNEAFKVIFEGLNWPENLPDWLELIWRRWTEGVSSELDTRAKLLNIEQVLTEVSKLTRSWG
ncbi:MAG: hypothetical protein GJ679_03790 [Rhodobacteraceae bacterium]|uniref:hypothetical protein n=1 Tax=Roseovarius sp. 10 TaxID=3080563 RepID=UPI0019369F4A|nr:hypothetical protein [Roseovarius sp. 10]MBE1289111.1 hypothetical protein [Paracoccaceae bacterium]MDV7200945.1 hypothetical protein [Roseovarius sp. 10]QPI85201.1 hypothetical protein I3V23_11685 [Rhodobacterales bacterium HKCCA1288]